MSKPNIIEEDKVFAKFLVDTLSRAAIMRQGSPIDIASELIAEYREKCVSAIGADLDRFTSYNLATVEGMPKAVSKSEIKRLTNIADMMVDAIMQHGVHPKSARTMEAVTLKRFPNIKEGKKS